MKNTNIYWVFIQCHTLFQIIGMAVLYDMLLPWFPWWAKWVSGKFNNILSWDFNLKVTWKFFRLSHKIIISDSCYDYRSDAICILFQAHACNLMSKTLIHTCLTSLSPPLDCKFHKRRDMPIVFTNISQYPGSLPVT